MVTVGQGVMSSYCQTTPRLSSGRGFQTLHTGGSSTLAIYCSSRQRPFSAAHRAATADICIGSQHTSQAWISICCGGWIAASNASGYGGCTRQGLPAGHIRLLHPIVVSPSQPTQGRPCRGKAFIILVRQVDDAAIGRKGGAQADGQLLGCWQRPEWGSSRRQACPIPCCGFTPCILVG